MSNKVIMYVLIAVVVVFLYRKMGYKLPLSK